MDGLAASLRLSAPAGDAFELKRMIAATKSRLLQTHQEVSLGRYQVQGWLGAGSFGVVYRGFDPRTQRDVAIKLHHEAHAKRLGHAANATLRREARRLAALNHPNVVHVLDVGLAGPRLFIVMELVTGETLSAWAARPRTVAERLAVLDEIAQGLCAAHASAIVHRDLKPANIFVSPNGVKLVDFGLAIKASTAESRTQSQDSAGSTGSDTQRRAGTPAYMAPEQRSGGLVDERADQFALALVAHGLFHDASLLPSHIRKALARAMSTEPEQRFASVEALRRALRAPRRRGSIYAGAAFVVAIGLAAVLQPPEPFDICDTADTLGLDMRKVEGIGVELRASTQPQAATLAQRFERSVEDYARDYAQSVAAACAMPAPAQADCLVLQHHTVATRIDHLAASRSDELPALLSRALPLPQVSACTDHRAREFSSPQQLRLRIELSRLETLRKLGAFRDASAQLTGLQAPLAAEGDDALNVDALALHGRIELDLGNSSAGRELIRRAVWLAVSMGDDRATLDHATKLASVEAQRFGDIAAAQKMLRQAMTALQRAGSPARQRARYWLAVSMVARVSKDTATVLEAANKVVQAQADTTQGPTALARRNLAVALLQTGSVDRAMELLERSVAQTSRPVERAADLEILSSILGRKGEVSRAIELGEEAAVLFGDSLGPQHYRTLNARSNLATTALASNPTRALEHFQAVVQGFEGVMPGTLSLVRARHNLAQAQWTTGQLDAARSNALRVVTEADELTDVPAAVLAGFWAGLGMIRDSLGEQAAARAAFERAAELDDGTQRQSKLIQNWLQAHPKAG